MENLKKNSEVDKIVEEIYFFISTRQRNKFIENLYVHFSCDIRTEILEYLNKKYDFKAIINYSILADYYTSYIVENTNYFILIEEQQNKYYKISNAISNLTECYFNQFNNYHEGNLEEIFNRIELNFKKYKNI